jgi:hypothetical protein
MTTFLRFDDEAAFASAFAPHIIDGAVPTYIGSAAVDVVGVIYKPTGLMLDTDDGPAPEFQALLGWHVNLSEPVPEFAEYEIPAPATPSRIFAGD